MADAPSPIASSLSQTDLAAREAAGVRDLRRAGQRQAAIRQTQSVDEAGVIVETSDDNARVFTDAEGSGSQGRPFEEHAENANPARPDDVAPGVTQGADGHLHVDLQA